MQLKETITLICLIIILSCSPLKNVKTSSQSLNIQGDWIDLIAEDNRGYNSATIFSFQDKLCSYGKAYGDFSPYWLKGDTLNIKEKGEYKTLWNGNTKYVEKKGLYRFLVKKKNNKEITLKVLSAPNQLLKNKEIKLKKTTVKNNIKFERIAFYSTSCSNYCPEIRLEIDNKGELLFLGEKDSKIKGLSKGNISKFELNLINNKINAIQLDNLKLNYIENSFEEQTCGLKIKNGNKIYETSVYGNGGEPLELRLLLHKLMEIYKTVELENDPEVKNQFQIKFDKISTTQTAAPMEGK